MTEPKDAPQATPGQGGLSLEPDTIEDLEVSETFAQAVKGGDGGSNGSPNGFDRL